MLKIDSHCEDTLFEAAELLRPSLRRSEDTVKMTLFAVTSFLLNNSLSYDCAAARQRQSHLN